MHELETMTTTQTVTMKSLIVLSKYLGIHKQFSRTLKEYQIKTHRPNALSAFLRMLNTSERDTLSWLRNEAMPHLRDNEKTWIRYLLLSGLRTSESIDSFNLIIELARQNKLSQYYNSEIGCLQHFKFPKLFIRGTKNAYITFMTEDLLNEIAHSQPLTYTQIRKRLERVHIKMRCNELRDLFGTTLVNNGVLEMEQNLVCGRIPVSIFIRHYWSPRLKELGNRIFKALENIDSQQQQPLTVPS
jgi:intergrase/recombinase